MHWLSAASRNPFLCFDTARIHRASTHTHTYLHPHPNADAISFPSYPKPTINHPCSLPHTALSYRKMTVDTSYLTTQVNNIVSQLHGVFDEIGVPSHERETREAEVGGRSRQCIMAVGHETDETYSSLVLYRKH